MERPNIIWVGITDNSGIGRAGREYIQTIAKNIDVRLCDVGQQYNTNDEFNKYRHKNIVGDYTLIVHGLPTSWDDSKYINKLRERAKQSIRLFAWETTPIPKEFEDDIWSRYDKVIVPSQYNYQAMRNKENVHIIPHLVNPPEVQRVLPKTDKIQVLYICSQATARKGIDILAKVIDHKYDNIEFIVKMHDYNSLKMLRSMTQHNFRAITQKLSDQDVWNLYHSVDYVLNLSRGEGFGYTYHDPIAVGINTCVIGPKIEPTNRLWLHIDKWENKYIQYDWDYVDIDMSTYHQNNISFDSKGLQWIEPDINSVVNILHNLKKKCPERTVVMNDPTNKKIIRRRFLKIL